MENWHGPIYIKYIHYKLPWRKIQIIKHSEEIVPNTTQTNSEKGTFCSSFYEVNKTLIPHPGKGIPTKKLAD